MYILIEKIWSTVVYKLLTQRNKKGVKRQRICQNTDYEIPIKKPIKHL